MPPGERRCSRVRAGLYRSSTLPLNPQEGPTVRTLALIESFFSGPYTGQYFQFGLREIVTLEELLEFGFRDGSEVQAFGHKSPTPSKRSSDVTDGHARHDGIATLGPEL